MKWLSITLALFVTALRLSAQNEEVELDFPEIPSSPAFILMGVSPSQVESPGTPSDLMVSVQNASSDFTRAPDNYFVNIAPYWLINKKHVSYGSYRDGNLENIENNVLQTLQVSVGVSDSFQNEAFDRRVGLGFGFSLFRGRINEDIEEEYFAKLKDYNTEVGKLQAEAENADQVYNDIEKEISEIGIQLTDTTISALGRNKLKERINYLNKKLEQRSKDLYEQIKSDYIATLKTELKEIKFKRTGFFANVAGGVAWDQTNNDSKVYQGGAWVNVGYQSKNINWIGVIRILRNEQTLMQNTLDMTTTDTTSVTTFDFGLKLDYEAMGKASVSGELIYRTAPNTDNDSSYRAALNVAYNLTKDVKINFTYGKDFEVFLTGESNYFALLNFAFGIGQGRKLDLSSL